MSLTVEITDPIETQVRRRAVRDSISINDAVVNLLHIGLAAEPEEPEHLEAPVIVTNPLTGFPMIHCRPAKPGEELTPERLAEILHQQEVEWYLAAGR